LFLSVGFLWVFYSFLCTKRNSGTLKPIHRRDI
jgi:hypothetical protein